MVDNLNIRFQDLRNTCCIFFNLGDFFKIHSSMKLKTRNSSINKVLPPFLHINLFRHFKWTTTYGCMQTYFRVYIHSFCFVCSHLLESLERLIFGNRGSINQEVQFRNTGQFDHYITRKKASVIQKVLTLEVQI